MDRIMVYVVLGGGNDALNTLIPLDTNNNNLYYSLRPTIGISNPVQLTGTQLGVHPAAQALKDLYDADKAAIIQGVHYDNPNKSHFVGTDIKISAADGNSFDANNVTGFLGDFLDERYPDYPGSFPNPDFIDPLAISMGPSVPQIVFKGGTNGINMGINLQGSPVLFRNIVLTVDQPQTNPLGLSASKQKIAKWYAADTKADNFSAAMANSWSAGTNAVTYPTGTSLPTQFADVAKMIKGGSKTQVYVVTVGGFDTHADQVVGGTPETGTHATLLAAVFDNIQSFLNDLDAAGSTTADRVLVQTFTEFGRQVGENGSLGTDHGTQCQTFLFGNGVEKGIYGSTPDLSNLSVNDYATYEYDYRQILATTMADWMGAGTVQLTAMGLNTFTQIPFIKTSYKFPTGDRDQLYNQ